MSDVSIQLVRGRFEGMLDETEWWKVQERRGPDIFDPNEPPRPQFYENITMIAFNDRVAPAGFASLVGYGYVGHNLQL